MKVDFKLYLITDRKQTRIPVPIAVRQALQGGARAVQLREKDLPIRELLALAEELRAITKQFGARLFVNDRVDVALTIGADGVHLPQAGLPPVAVRRIAGNRLLIGVSAHTLEEAKAAEADAADFITFGPVFHTPSKAAFGRPVGLDELKQVKSALKIPVIALGGIKSGNIRQVLDSGADGAAMISEIFGSTDIQSAAQSIITELS